MRTYICALQVWWNWQQLTYEHIDRTAHAVFLVLVMHDGPVVQQPLQQTHYQIDKELAHSCQVLVLPTVLQQTGVCCKT